MQTDVRGGIKSPSFCWDRAGCLRDTMSSLLLLLLLGLRVIESATGKWRPCTDLLPLDILSRVVPTGSSAPLPAVHMIQSGGVRGVRFSRPHPSLSFPSSQLLANCDLLPKEFSIVVTLKVSNMAPKRNEYLLSVVEDNDKGNKGLKAEQDDEDDVRDLQSKGEKDKRQMILGLRVSRDRFHYLFKGHGGVTKHLVFRGVRLADNRWHTLVLVVSGQRARLTIDCSTMLEESSPLLSNLRIQGSRFHVSSRGRWKGLFSGLLRQLVLVPGSDATSKICPSSNPRLTELIVPPLLLDLSNQGKEARVYQPSHEATVRVSVGVERLCSEQLRGQLWFNPFTRGLYLCDGSVWVTMLQEHNRLDYVTEHQVLITSSETYDVEVFHVPGFGLMAAMAHRSPSSGSTVYLWSQKGFQLYQNISTHGALVWRHFRLGKKLFLVVSNSGEGMEGEKEREVQLSTIYKWSKKRKMFEWFQTLQTHSARDWEAFHIDGQAYLVVANHRQGDNNHTIDSVVYRWSPGIRSFEVHQALRTSGAYDWEYFTVGLYHFLVVANAFDGVTTHVDSVIYVWVNGRFQVFQTIKTFCATDWEMFKIGSRVFLVVANGHRLNSNGHSRYAINSTIYELDINEQLFIRFQDIITYSAVDWEFFALGEENFLVVANSFDGESYSLNSVLYRWQGYEGFVPVHWLPTIGCSDWEFFTSEGNAYLIYSSATASLAKVFKLKTL